MLPPLSPDHVEYAIAGGIGAQVVDDRAQLTPAPSTGTGGFMQEKSAGAYRVRLWVPGDWNAFFGFFTNVALNVLVATGLSLGVVRLPTDIVLGRILPALGIALPIGNIYYAYLAYRLAKRERRDDVAALPYGPSVPQFFICVFVVMLPTLLATGDPVKAWRAGLTRGLVLGGLVLIAALLVPPPHRSTP